MCIKQCKSLWIKASAKCPNCKLEYLSSHLVLFETYKTLSTTSVALQKESTTTSVKMNVPVSQRKLFKRVTKKCNLTTLKLHQLIE